MLRVVEIVWMEIVLRKNTGRREGVTNTFKLKKNKKRVDKVVIGYNTFKFADGIANTRDEIFSSLDPLKNNMPCY